MVGMGLGEAETPEMGIAEVSTAPSTEAFHFPAAIQGAWDDSADTQALPRTVSKGWLVLPAPSLTMGTHPALPP